MFKNMKLGLKLGSGFGLVCLVMLVVGGVGYYGASKLATLLGDVTGMLLPGVETLGVIDETQTGIKAAERTLIAKDMPKERVEREYKHIEDGLNVADEHFMELANLDLTPEETKMLQKIQASWAEWVKGVRESQRLNDLYRRTASNTDYENFEKQVLEANSKSFKDSKAAIEEMATAFKNESTNTEKTARDLIVTVNRTVIAAVLIGLLLGVVAAFFITRAITRPVVACMDAAGKIAEGDVNVTLDTSANDETGQLQRAMSKMAKAIQALTVDANGLAQAAVEGKLSHRADASKHKGDYAKIVEGMNRTMDAVATPLNEASSVLGKLADRDMTVRMVGNYSGDYVMIKESLNKTADSLQTALVQVTESVEQVTSASNQISSGSQSLAQGANEQASSLEQISSNLEEMASMVKQNTENANQANILAETAKQQAEKGNEAMVKMGDAIDKIKKSADETAKIIKTIDEIAFQTNLLALNAAVEAARAGEAGKGFAVVAEEVRNLAMRSAEAAKNTSALIEESQKNSENGVAVSDQVGGILKQIVGGAQKVAQLIAEVSAATNEQAKGIDQVNQGVSELNKVTQQNASLSEESASAAEELNGQSEELAQMVSTFVLAKAGEGRSMIRKETARTKVARHPQAMLPHHSKAAAKAQAKTSEKAAATVKMEELRDAEMAIPLTDEELKRF